MNTEPQPDGVAGELRQLAAELRHTIDELRAGGELPPGGISFGKRVGEGTNIAIERFTDVAIHDQLIAQLEAVDLALAHIDAGTYGRCEVCGQHIPLERLEAIPWAARCVRCA